MPCNRDVNSENILEFIIRYTTSPQTLSTTLRTDCIDIVSSQFAVAYYPMEQVPSVPLSSYTYRALPKLYTLMDTASMDASGITAAIRSPALGNRGRGVLIGFVDTGIDYLNPLFRKSDGTTRIVGIWDQTIPSPGGQNGPGGPEQDRASGFGPFAANYGTMYTEEQINAALRSGDPFSIVPSADADGHGTFLASVAAGNEDEALDFTGAAPEAAIAMVKLKPAKQYLRDFFLIRDGVQAYQENDIMTAVRYLLNLAGGRGMPVVICISAGTNQGSHDGKSPLGLFLDSVGAFMGAAVTVAAGNETGYGHHYHGIIDAGEPSEDVELRVGEGETGFCLELWAPAAELYRVGFVSPTGEVIDRIRRNATDENRITFLMEKTEITVYYRIADANSGSQLIFMRFQDPLPGIWHIIVYNSLYLRSGYHIWLPCRPFISDDTYFLRPDPDVTITEPGNAQAPITAAAYNHRTGSLYIHSSRGFSRSGEPKPDLAAPGVDVEGAGLGLPAAFPADFPMTQQTGTSVAAAHLAGAAASFLSWGIVEGNDPYMTTSVIKTYLIRGANRNPAFAYPNREFGYGTLDLYQAFLSLRE